MPKANTSKSSNTMDQSLLVITDGSKRVLIPRPKTYLAAIEVARRHFPSIRAQEMVLQTDKLAICEDELTDIAAESWETVIGFLSSVLVAERHECSKQRDDAVIPFQTRFTSQSRSQTGVKY
ncbi:hypothetical protein B0H13DRAFT_856048 [Mycena leptocephala]|nr:hypothetical protein B0H13DRAFT_856048 [Mycena leptocephala]